MFRCIFLRGSMVAQVVVVALELLPTNHRVILHFKSTFTLHINSPYHVNDKRQYNNLMSPQFPIDKPHQKDKLPCDPNPNIAK
uniref:Uncharacterized protein n=1 Tax=Arundo donax TaxID=35708 RepID=A0A0A9DAM0_ARUDO